MRKNATKILIICQSSIMHEAISDSLKADGFECIDCKKTADIAIVVTGLMKLRPEAQTLSDNDLLDGITTKNWVILSSSKNDRIFDLLRKAGINSCRVPDDINKNDLSNVIHLAAGGHTISMGKFCHINHIDNAKKLSEANLDKEQWKLLSHLAYGETNKEIAIKEHTTESAVKARLRCLLNKLGINNRTKAAVLAARCDININT